jgi:hypothetical protein
MSMFTSGVPGIMASEEMQGTGLVTVASKTNWGSNADASSYVSSSVTTTAGALCILVGMWTVASPSVANATISGATCLSNLNGVSNAAFNSVGAPLYEIEVWIAKGTGTASTITASFGGTQTSGFFVLFQCSNVNVAGGPIWGGTGGTNYGVQQVQTINDGLVYDMTRATGTGIGCPLNPFTSINNGTFSVVGVDYPPTWDPNIVKPGWTCPWSPAWVNPSAGAAAAWTAYNDQTPKFYANATSQKFAGVSMELVSI